MGPSRHHLLMTTYEILVPADVAEKCFLIEVLYWRAFGRVPIEFYTSEGPYREDPEVYEDIAAPIPSEGYLSDEECAYAGLPPDPHTKALEEGISTNADFYQRMLEVFQAQDPIDEKQVRETEHDLNQATAHQIEAKAWDLLYEEYVDEFATEICLDLRRGNLTAFGRKLPNSDPDRSLEELEGKDLWLDSLEVSPIPAQAWISQNIDWSDSAIYGSHSSYIWIYLNTAEVLERYPPETLIKPGSAFPIGSTVAVAGFQPARQGKTSARGRPPLPWDDFQVEVARLYADGEMPTKKEAAIALLREWFQEHKQKDVSRSAIGAKLKPYFDKIGRK